MRPPLLSMRVETRPASKALSGSAGRPLRAAVAAPRREPGEQRFQARQREFGCFRLGHRYLTAGVAPVTPALGVAGSPGNPSDSSLRPIESTFAAGSGRSSALTI